MKPTPLADVLEHPADAVIYSLRATVKNVFPRKTGEIKKGPNTGNPWALQNLELTDGNVTVPMVMKDREDEIPKSWIHREILLEAHQGPKGWSGVYAFDDDYTNPPTRKIKVTITGVVSLVDGSAEARNAPPQTPPRQQQQPRQQQAPAKAQQQQPAPPREQEQPTAHTTGTVRDVAEVASKANQIANLQLLCLTTTAEYTAARFKSKTGRELTTQEIHAMATSMCIELFRSASYTKMPTSRMGATGPQHPPATPRLQPGQTPTMWEGKPWPIDAVPDPETGAPIDPETGNYIF